MKHRCKIRTHAWVVTYILILGCYDRFPSPYQSRIRGTDGSNLHLPNTEIWFQLNQPVVTKNPGDYVGLARLWITFENQSKEDTLRVDTNDIKVLPQMVPWILGSWKGMC